MLRKLRNKGYSTKASSTKVLCCLEESHVLQSKSDNGETKMTMRIEMGNLQAVEHSPLKMNCTKDLEKFISTVLAVTLHTVESYCLELSKGV